MLVQNGRIVSGQRLDGILVVTAPEPIPRAEEIDLLFKSDAWASYGESSISRVMFEAPFELALPKGEPFAAGEHRYPFFIDIPAWLPPELHGGTFGIDHSIDVKLEVDWAFDPSTRFRWPPVHMQPRSGVRRPITMRSRPDFFHGVVLEVTLTSTTVAIGEYVQGQIALRNGHTESFNAVDLELTSNGTIVMGGPHERHSTPLTRIRIPGDRLRAGETVSFSFPTTPTLAPSYRTSFIDHDVSIRVTIPTAALGPSPSFHIPIDMLPEGSMVEGSTPTTVLGGERVRRIAKAMAIETGLNEGTAAPVLVYGDVGPVGISIVDAARNGKLGVDVDFTFPDLQLGLLMRRRGVVEELVGSPGSPFLPPPLWDRQLVFKARDKRPKIEDAVLVPLFQAVFGGSVDEARLSDHHFGSHITIIDDEPPRMIELAREMCGQARRIGDAISALPFPEPLTSARSAWQATANEQNAFLVPMAPAIHGIIFRAQILGGEERTIRVDLRTIWKSETPLLQAFIDVRNAAIPEAGRKNLEAEESASSLLTSVRSTFPKAQMSGETLVLGDAKWPDDPRVLLPTLETFLGWILEARGERRVDAPYR